MDYIFFALVLLPFIAVIFIYNGIIYKRNRVNNAFAGIDAQLKKRHDLIPNLVAAVKGYMTHESETFTKITDLRSKAMSGNLGLAEKTAVENGITSALKSIMVSVENYPVLKASENFMHLQRTLNEIEEQLSAARRTYNASVNDYNNSIQMFPSNIIANMFRFQEKRFFEINESDRANIELKEVFRKDK
jgi:LemA protein